MTRTATPEMTPTTAPQATATMAAATPQPTIAPLPTSTPDLEAMLEEGLEQIEQIREDGRIEYNDPGVMEVDRVTVIYAQISVGPRETLTETVAPIIEGAEGTPRTRSLRVTSLMEVRLVAEDPRDFEITEMHSSAKQLLDDADPPTWSWSVRPLRPGSGKRLQLQIIAIARAEGAEDKRNLEPEIITLTIQVTPVYSVRRYGWIGLVLVGLIVGGYFLRRHWQHSPPQAQAPVSNAMLRQQLQRLDDVDLNTLCLDYFPKVFDKFSGALRRDEKINLLLEYCYRNPEEGQRLEELLKS